MEKINIYAPVSGTTHPIKALNDGVFSEKMLGDGFYIQPSLTAENDFASIFEQATIVHLFDTRHAFYIKAKNGPTVLVHIGLDTVNLSGKPFQLDVSLNDAVELNDRILTVDWQQIRDLKIADAIPIVLDSNDNPGWTIELIKTGPVHKGDLVATISFQKAIRKTKKFKLSEALKGGILLKDKYTEIAEQIFDLVGTDSNYTKYYNCITRFRLSIKDKQLVREDLLKQINGVKGINWNGNELQIIFGAEVSKVRFAYDKFIADGPKPLQPQDQIGFELSNREGRQPGLAFGSKILAMFKGIILPTLPVFIGVTLIIALKAILEISGVIKVLGTTSDFSQYSFFEVFLFNLTYTLSSFITLFIAYNAAKYFGGNPLYALMVGLILCAPLLFRGTINANNSSIQPWSYALWTTNSFVEDGLKVTWLKFGGLNTSLINGILIGYLVAKIGAYFTKKIPSSLQMVAYPPLVIGAVVVIMFFVAGPLIGMIETFLGQMVGLLIKIKYGFDRLIFGFLWPMLVITGAHTSLLMIVQMPWTLDPGNIYINIDLMGALFNSALGQLAVGIGILIKTKNTDVKRNIYSALPASVFNISEPMMYGVTIPSGFKSFLFGCLACGLGAFTSGVIPDTGHYWKQGGSGILSVINVLGPNMDLTSLLANAAGWIVTLSVGISLTLLFVNSRENEYQTISSLDKKIIRLLVSNNVTPSAYANLQTKMTELENNYSKASRNKIIELEKLYQKLSVVKLKMSKLEEKEQDRKVAAVNRFNKLLLKRGVDNAKLQAQLNTKLNAINAIDYSDQINRLEDIALELELQISENDAFYKKITAQSQQLAHQIVQESLQLLVNDAPQDFAHIENNYYNAINSLNISVKLNDKRLELFAPKKTWNFKKLQKK